MCTVQCNQTKQCEYVFHTHNSHMLWTVCGVWRQRQRYQELLFFVAFLRCSIVWCVTADTYITTEHPIIYTRYVYNNLNKLPEYTMKIKWKQLLFRCLSFFAFQLSITASKSYAELWHRIQHTRILKWLLLRQRYWF